MKKKNGHKLLKTGVKEWTSLLLQEREYSEKFCVNRFNNCDKIDKFFGRYKLPKAIQEKNRKFNRSITSKEIDFVI